MSPAQVVSALLASPTVAGLTFSGGEPMLQAVALAEVARMARGQRELNIICFTGFSHKELIHTPPNPGVYALLKELDVLIDGRYVRARNTGIGLRGSDNQKIIHLTDRLRGVDLEGAPRLAEITIAGNAITMIGVPGFKVSELQESLLQARSVVTGNHP